MVVCLGLLRGLVQATFKRMQAERVVQAQPQRALLRQSQLPPVDLNRGLGLAMYQTELAERAAMENQKTETPLVIATHSAFGSSLSCVWGCVWCCAWCCAWCCGGLSDPATTVRMYGSGPVAPDACPSL